MTVILRGILVPVCALAIGVVAGLLVYRIGVVIFTERSVYAANLAALLAYTVALYHGWKFTA